MQLPVKTIRAITKLLVPELDDAASGSKLVLYVHIETDNLVARDFAAFLELADHIYGRTSDGGFASYARKSEGHFKFSESRRGSWLLLAKQALEAAASASPLVLVWLALKYVPPGIQSLATAFNETQQGLLAREQRKQIRAEMNQDKSLAALPNADRAEAERFVAAVAEKDADLVPRARRFVAMSVRSIELRVEGDGENDGADDS